jgi:hypothetical protein
MKVDASRILPPTTTQIKSKAPLADPQSEPKGPPKQVEKSATVAETAPQKNRAQGAIKLLQEGHFKGVAALRLSINFFDQLSDLEQKTNQVAAQEGIAELSLALQEQIGGLSTSGLIEEETLPRLADLTETFLSEIQSSAAGEEWDQQQLTTSLEHHYDNYRTALQDLLLPPEPTLLQEAEAGQTAASEEIAPGADQGAANSPTTISQLETELVAAQTTASPLQTVVESESQVQLATRLEELDSSFRSQLSSITERLQGASLPPVPEQPDNQGAAFQKFLTIYREMQDMAEVGSEQTEAKGS